MVARWSLTYIVPDEHTQDAKDHEDQEGDKQTGTAHREVNLEERSSQWQLLDIGPHTHKLKIANNLS